MKTSDLMQAMAAAGAPMEAIILAVKALEEKDAVIEARRANDRDRKRRQRGTVTGQSRDTDGTVTDNTPPDKSPPDPQKLTPPPTPTGIAPARKAEPFPRPEWADAEVWSDLLTNRRKKNLPNTASAHRKLLADIDKLVDAHWPPGRVLEAAVSRGWGAIYASCKDDDDGRNQANRGGGQRLGGHQRSDGLSPTTRAARDVFGLAAGH